MAKFTAAAGVDFTKFDVADLGTGNPAVHTDKDYKLEVAANDFNEFFGTGFKYDPGFDLIGGTLNEISSTEVSELYDVAVLPGVIRPMALGFKTDEIHRTIAIGDQGSL